MISRIFCTMMLERDIEKVLTIERSVFRHPWSHDFFRLILSDMNNYVVTLRNENGILGYGGYHLLKNRANFLYTKEAYERTIHIINIAIQPREQHRGFGTFLMNTLMGNARSRNAEYCYLEVRPSNQQAYSFYRKCGFSVIGVIENYYPQERENALVMGMGLK